MNCFHEMISTMWMFALEKINPSSAVTEIASAEESLHLCKNDLHLKLRELEDLVTSINKDVLRYKQASDIASMRVKLHERKRHLSRIDKIKNNISIVERQIDTLQSNELDKALFNSLKVSNQIMKKSGIKVNVSEVENVMNELDEHIHESSELNQILGTPLQSNDMFSITEDEEDELEADLMQDLEKIEQEQGQTDNAPTPITIKNKTITLSPPYHPRQQLEVPISA